MSKEEKIVSFQLVNLDILGIQISDPEGVYQEESAHMFKADLEHIIDVKENLVIVKSTIQIRYKDSEEDIVNFSSSCSFNVQNLGDFVDSKSGVVELPNGFVVTINSVSISTARGMLYTQLKGTYLHRAILPLFEPNSFKREEDAVS